MHNFETLEYHQHDLPDIAATAHLMTGEIPCNGIPLAGMCKNLL